MVYYTESGSTRKPGGESPEASLLRRIKAPSSKKTSGAPQSGRKKVRVGNIGIYCKHVWYGAVRYGTVRYGTVRYVMLRYGTLCYSTVRYGTVRYVTVR